MKRMLTLCDAVRLLVAASVVRWPTPEIPGAPQDHPIALVGGTVHPVSGPAIEGGTVLFDGGKIVAIGRDVAMPDDAERIDVAGQARLSRA